MNIPVAALLAGALCSGRNDAFQSPLSRAVRRQHSRVAVAASSVTADAPPLITTTVTVDNTQDSSSNEDSSEFNWFKAWYPIVPVKFLNYEKPHAFKLLGMDIVIWNDGRAI